MPSDERLRTLLTAADRSAPGPDQPFRDALYGQLQRERRRRHGSWARTLGSGSKPALGLAAGLAAVVFVVVVALVTGQPHQGELPVGVSPTPIASPRPTVTPTTTTQPSRSPSPSPSPSVATPSTNATARPTAAPPSGGLPRGPVAAGTYTITKMTPHVRLTLPNGFTMRDLQVDSLWLTVGTETNATEFVIARVFEHGVIDQLAKAPAFTTLKREPTTVDGIAGQAIELEGSAAASTFTPMFSTAETIGGFALTPGAHARVIELDVNGAAVVIEFSAQVSDFEAYRATADNILRTLVFP